MTAADAVQGKDVVILSVPFARIPDVAGLFASVPAETVVIDTSNYFPQFGGPSTRSTRVRWRACGWPSGWGVLW